ncbi:hypothetical protein [Bacillus toyonensis]|nr:hypothetical protein [Bacillus toyonensis]
MEIKNNKKSSVAKTQNKKQSFPPVYLEDFLDETTKKRLLELKNKSSK